MTRRRGPRWDLALSLIASGEAPVHLGALTIWRDTAGPRSTGLVRITVEAAENTPVQGAKALLDDLQEHVAHLGASDARLQSLLFEYGYSCEIEANYGMGTVLLAGPRIACALARADLPPPCRMSGVDPAATRTTRLAPLGAMPSTAGQEGAPRCMMNTCRSR